MKSKKPWILPVIGLVAVLLGVGAILAAGESERDRVERKGTVKVAVVDDDGDRHVETFELDGDSPRPFLGVRLGAARDGGAVIEGVIEDTAAERAGLRDGDVIVGFDGQTIDSPWDLTRLVLRSEPGDRIDLELIRDGGRETVTVEVGERDDWVGVFAPHGWDADAFEEQMERLGERLQDMEFHFDSDALEEQMEHLGERLQHMRFEFGDLGHHGWGMRSGRPVLGVELVDATPELRQHLGGSADEGLLVGRVLPDSPAEAAGVQVGDLIVTLGGEPIEDVSDLRRALDERAGATFDLDVIRDGRRTSLSVSLPEQEEDAPSPSMRRRIERRHEPRSDADRT